MRKSIFVMHSPNDRPVTVIVCAISSKKRRTYATPFRYTQTSTYEIRPAISELAKPFADALAHALQFRRASSTDRHRSQIHKRSTRTHPHPYTPSHTQFNSMSAATNATDANMPPASRETEEEIRAQLDNLYKRMDVTAGRVSCLGNIMQSILEHLKLLENLTKTPTAEERARIQWRTRRRVFRAHLN